jgi:hypothetical protein
MQSREDVECGYKTGQTKQSNVAQHEKVKHQQRSVSRGSNSAPTKTATQSKSKYPVAVLQSANADNEKGLIESIADQTMKGMKKVTNIVSAPFQDNRDSSNSMQVKQVASTKAASLSAPSKNVPVTKPQPVTNSKASIKRSAAGNRV